ncbi:hypothetical protein C8R44DRAFT_320474 [Mycena epipterygia]|nr:hypothetical protein C8R44DRAFT_320474 [Mycena epipterygia]
MGGGRRRKGCRRKSSCAPHDADGMEIELEIGSDLPRADLDCVLVSLFLFPSFLPSSLRSRSRCSFAPYYLTSLAYFMHSFPVLHLIPSLGLLTRLPSLPYSILLICVCCLCFFLSLPFSFTLHVPFFLFPSVAATFHSFLPRAR